MFTVPSGADGLYYFSIYRRVDGAEWGQFNVEINGKLFCTVFSDLTESPDTDSEITTCSGVSYACEGNNRDCFLTPTQLWECNGTVPASPGTRFSMGLDPPPPLSYWKEHGIR